MRKGFKGREVPVRILGCRSLVYGSCSGLASSTRMFCCLCFLYVPRQGLGSNVQTSGLVRGVTVRMGNCGFRSLDRNRGGLVLVRYVAGILNSGSTLILFSRPSTRARVTVGGRLLEIISRFRNRAVVAARSPVFLGGH